MSDIENLVRIGLEFLEEGDEISSGQIADAKLLIETLEQKNKAMESVVEAAKKVNDAVVGSDRQLVLALHHLEVSLQSLQERVNEI
jgi:rRNA-processing protein FCF1